MAGSDRFLIVDLGDLCGSGTARRAGHFHYRTRVGAGTSRNAVGWGEIVLLPLTEIILPMGRSMFSAFALARRTGEDVEAIFRRLTGMTVVATLPTCIGLALVAEPLVRLM